MKEKVYLLVSNHLKPERKSAQGSGVSPDALILSKLVEQTTEQKIKIVQKSDNG